MHRLTLLLIALAACGPTTTSAPRSQPPSRGLHADEHVDAAREHARRADELSRWPETRRNDIGRFDDPNTGLWYRAWDQAADHERLAKVHASIAAQQHAAYDEACANIAPERARVSPLQRLAHGGMPTADGVVFFLDTDAGPPDRLLAEMRCHRAWMMLSSGAGMEMCPLDLPDLLIQAHGDPTGISVELRVKDPALLPELKRRAAHELELSARQRAAL